jgi:hypothetical protein
MYGEVERFKRLTQVLRVESSRGGTLGLWVLNQPHQPLNLTEQAF